MIDGEEESIVLELEKLLLNDVNGSSRAAINEDMQNLRRSLKRDIDSGVTLRQFEALQTLLEAIDCATEVVDATWMRHHREIVR
ncbi:MULTISPECIES: EscE/YscE/SsaE family type III secretion system needle protein co-chaperone [Bradyrhizobium]|uniref:EscE/YscE/SsaE family type III secretion system needle protein co-chaperone n=1 Tax=Bradyrhizobium TaxID=374 RepID=UPI00048D3EC0|nr:MULTISPECIES: EscE/YscE/SsaE family type III secretion system needle protein co-chaperone [Bradyrhizobium]MCK7664751.1 EscE/YscE/SsaE family type III secretion system needle protein co-chaperone [Bradyrhizobium sp. 2S1]UGY30290.1 EscE/YscE/SsaE family type III secretion system needle protein co-chaperone [Bradyrhizobium septentrionale]